MMETPTNTPTIICKQDNWMVLNKPSRWHSVRPGKKSSSTHTTEPNVEDYLKENNPSLQNLPECGLVHRLDFLTSGCLLVARDEQQQKRLQSLFKKTNQSRLKTYLAVVPQNMTPPQGQFELYFTSRYRRSKIMTVREEGHERDRGVCRWATINYFQEQISTGPPFNILRINIIGPGKRHQIRAGLAHLGYPIHGDSLYSGISPWQGGFGLHARTLRVDNIEVNAPLPESWNVKI